MGVAAGKGRSQDVDLFQLKPLIFKSGNPYKTKFSIENKRKTFSILNVGEDKRRKTKHGYNIRQH